MIYSDDRLTVNVDEIIAITNLGQSILLVFENSTVEVNYYNAVKQERAYEELKKLITEVKQAKLK